MFEHARTDFDDVYLPSLSIQEVFHFTMMINTNTTAKQSSCGLKIVREWGLEVVQAQAKKSLCNIWTVLAGRSFIFSVQQSIKDLSLKGF